MEGEVKNINENPNTPEQERTSGISKVIGATPEQERRVKEDFQEIMEGQGLDLLNWKKWDREKDEYEQKLVDKIVEKLPDFVRRYGGTPAPLKAENIHILDVKKLREDATAGDGDAVQWLREPGRCNIYDQQVISVPGTGPNLSEIIVHESMHFESFNSVEYTEAPESDDKKRLLEHSAKLWVKKSGFDMQPQPNEFGGNKNHYFSEGITQELTIRFLRELNENTHIGISTGTDSNGDKKYLGVKLRNKEIGLIRKIIKDIQEWFPKEFATEEDVFNIFAKGYFSGNMLPAAKLIEKRYGKGAFRYLAENDKIPRNHTDLPNKKSAKSMKPKQ